MSSRLALAILAITLAGDAARAQSRFNIGIGAAVPIGTTADQLNPGYNGTLSYTMKPNWMRNSLRIEYSVNSLPERTVVGARRQIQSGTVNLVIIGEPLKAPTSYVIVGLGTYEQSGSVVARHSDAGFNVGAGIRFTMGFFGTFVEARFHYVNATRTKYFPMTFGLTF